MRVSWLYPLLLIACGGRTLDDGSFDGPSEDGGSSTHSGGSGGSTSGKGGRSSGKGGAVGKGGAMGQGGAVGKGGAMGQGGRRGSGGAASLGGAFASGGAIVAFGGATAAGGSSGSSDPLTFKYCSAYCNQAFNSCPNGLAGTTEQCADHCVRAAAPLSPACREDFRQSLLCGLGAMVSCEVTPVRMWMACSAQISKAQRCGVSLPGAEFCSSTQNESIDNCSRTSACVDVKYASECRVDPATQVTTCSCAVNGQQQFAAVVNSDRALCQLAAGLACGPEIL